MYMLGIAQRSYSWFRFSQKKGMAVWISFTAVESFKKRSEHFYVSEKTVCPVNIFLNAQWLDILSCYCDDCLLILRRQIWKQFCCLMDSEQQSEHEISFLNIKCQKSIEKKEKLKNVILPSVFFSTPRNFIV